MEKKQAKTGRRQILANAIKETRELMGIDLKALAAIQEKFHREYDEILPQIAKEQTAIAEKRADRNLKALEQRYSAVKRLSAQKKLTEFGEMESIPYLWNRCWCDFLEDFTNANECGGDLIEETVDDPSKFSAESGHVSNGENKHKPLVSLRGSGDTTENIIKQDSWFKYVIDDDKFESSGNYCITPTVLLSGYWIKENWGVCGGGLESSGNIEIKLSLTASQLVGPPLGEKEVEVFSWQPGDSYTGAIDKIYNVSGNPSSIPLSLVVNVDPANGDVLVKVTLTITTRMTGNGRYLVDMKNSDAFYFWVERVELAKRKCRPWYCFPGGPRLPQCVVGGPYQQCSFWGPGIPEGRECVVLGPDIPEGRECVVLGPDIPEGRECVLSGPEPAGCPKGPPLDVIIDPGQWVEGQVTVELARVPKSMRRSLSKMFQQIRKS